jgi:hypothetical protein
MWRTVGFLAFALACSGSTPVDFAGMYSVTVQDGATNPCNLKNWTAGSSTANIPVTMTQDNTTAEFTVGGVAGDYLTLVIQTSSFPGTVMGDTFNATYLGTTPLTQQSCTYYLDLALQATLTNDSTMNGTLTYTTMTNGDPTCGALSTCSQQQIVSGVRTSQ